MTAMERLSSQGHMLARMKTKAVAAAIFAMLLLPVSHAAERPSDRHHPTHSGSRKELGEARMHITRHRENNPTLNEASPSGIDEKYQLYVAGPVQQAVTEEAHWPAQKLASPETMLRAYFKIEPNEINPKTSVSCMPLLFSSQAALKTLCVTYLC